MKSLVSRLHRSISHSWLRRARLCSNVTLLAGYLGVNSNVFTPPGILKVVHEEIVIVNEAVIMC